MGRKKSYDPDEVVAKAMHLFWERGYHATSTRDLTDAMGVNPYSLYAEFGSKEALYEAALDRYMATVFTGHFGRLESPEAGLAEVLAVLDWFGDNGTREGSELGCLMANTSTERAPNVASSRASTARFVERLTGAFTRALRQAMERGELREGAPVESIASSISAHLIGVLVLSRARVSPQHIRRASDQQIAGVRSFEARGAAART